MNKTVILLSATALALAACGQRPAAGDAPLAGARMGGPFALVDQDGRAVTERSWPGKWRAMYFGYSFCPDVCPVDLQKLMRGYAKFAAAHPAEAAKLQPIFVTVDPKRDTPAVLKEFVGAFGAPLIGLTGTAKQVAGAAGQYGVVYDEQRVSGASGYLVNHTRATVLYDPDGKPVALLPTDADADQVAAEMAKWVR